MARRKIVSAAAQLKSPVLDLREEGEGLTEEARTTPCVRTTSLREHRYRYDYSYNQRYADTKTNVVSRGWVAQIQGMDDQRRLERTFLGETRQTTLSDSRSTTYREHEYTMETPGLYEAQTVEAGEQRRVFFLFDEEGFQMLTRAEVYELVSPTLDFGEVRSHVSAGRWHDAWAAARCLENPDEREAAEAYVHRALSGAQSSLPDLEGTPRQIAWAMQLRQQALGALDAWREEVTKLQEARRTRDDLSAVYRRQDEARVELMTVTKAVEWIDHRDLWGDGRKLARMLQKRREKILREEVEARGDALPLERRGRVMWTLDDV